jgi:hypothetical protein
VPVILERCRVVDDSAIVERDDGIRQNAAPGRLRCRVRHNHLVFDMFDLSAQPRSAMMLLGFWFLCERVVMRQYACAGNRN